MNTPLPWAAATLAGVSRWTTSFPEEASLTSGMRLWAPNLHVMPGKPKLSVRDVSARVNHNVLDGGISLKQCGPQSIVSHSVDSSSHLGAAPAAAAVLLAC